MKFLTGVVVGAVLVIVGLVALDVYDEKNGRDQMGDE